MTLYPNNSGYDDFYEIDVELDLLLDRERQLLNMLDNGKWVCFLIDEINDKLQQSSHLLDVSNTDLCKRLLNHFDIKRSKINGDSNVAAKSNEFQAYITNYGIANRNVGLYG